MAEHSLSTISISTTKPGSIKPHTLLAAYETLNDTIRAALSYGDKQHPVIVQLGVNAGSISTALRRDVKLHLEEPDVSYMDSRPMEDAVEALKIHFGIPYAATKAASYIIRFPQLSHRFKTHHLQLLIKDVVDVLLSDSIPESMYLKTWLALLWMFRNQRVCAEVFIQTCSSIATVFQKGLSRDNEDIRVECLKTIRSLLSDHPATFVLPFAKLFRTIYDLLMDASIHLRIEAGRTIVALALNKLDHGQAMHGTFAKIAISTCDFVNDHSTKSASQSQAGQVKTALHLEKWTGSERPYWTIPVVGALIILSGWRTFAHGMQLQVLTQLLTGVYQQKRTNPLFYELWKCFALVYSYALDVHDVNFKKDKLDKATLFMADWLHGGIGEMLMGIILLRGEDKGESGGESIVQALSILKKMVSSRTADARSEGVKIFRTLIQVAGTDGKGKPAVTHFPLAKDFVHRSLFGDALFSATNENIKDVVTEQRAKSSLFVWQLSEAELDCHWTALLDIWCAAVSASVMDRNSSLLKDLGCCFKSLMKVTVNKKAFATSSTITGKIIFSVTGLLRLPNFDEGKCQVAVLDYLPVLWEKMKECSGTTDTRAFGTQLVQAILRATWSMDTDEVRARWLELCVDLVPYVNRAGFDIMTAFMDVMSDYPDAAAALWPAIARRCHTDPVDKKSDVQRHISFVRVSYGRWDISKEDLRLWEHFFDQILQQTRRPEELVTSLLKAESSLTDAAAKHCLVLVNLSSIELPDLPRDALSTIDDALLTIYPPPSGGLPDGVKIFFDRLGDYLQKPSSALPLLHGLRRSLKIWLSDDDGLVPVDYHARMVERLYCAPMQAIGPVHEPSLQFLLDMGDYCEAGLARPHGKEMTAVNAFEQLWREHYHDVEEFRGHYPISIVNCLRVLHDLGQTYVERDVPPSQFTPESIVPDSCPSQPWTPRQARARLFSLTPSREEERTTPQTGRRHRVGIGEMNAEEAEDEGTPTRKRSSPDYPDGERKLKRKKKPVLEGVIMESPQDKRSQLMTPCPSEPGSSQSVAVVVDEEKEQEKAEKGQWEVPDSQADEEDENEGVEMYVEQSQMPDDLEMAEESYVCPSPPSRPQRSYTEPAPRAASPRPPPALRRVQTTPASGTSVLDALRTASAALNDSKPLTKEEILEAQQLVHTLSGQLFRQMGSML